MKLFSRKPKDVFAKLDKLMSEMASEEIHSEYLQLRKVM